MRIIANVIFPAFNAPYIAPLFFPIAGISAIISELLIYRLLNRDCKASNLIFLVLFANIVSTILGFLLTLLLPSGLQPKLIDPGNGASTTTILSTGPDFEYLVIIAFPIACILSIIIEYFCLRVTSRAAKIISPIRTVVVANLVSYLILFGIACFYVSHQW